MALPAPFEITPDIRDTFQAGIDALIDQLGQDCQLVLDGDRGPCPNCRFDPTRSASAGVYNGSGPRPFTHPPCPVCQGSGYDPATLTRVEVRRFSVRRNVKAFEVFGPNPANLTRPAGLAAIKGYVDDLPLVLQAKHVVLDYRNAKFLNERYTKLREPSLTGNIVSGRYFRQYLQRVE